MFNPVTSVLVCHKDFSKPIDIGWDAVVGSNGGYTPPNENNVHHWLTDVWTKLVCIIMNLERSGQGEGTQLLLEDMIEDTNGERTLDNRDLEELSAAQLDHLENQSALVMHS